MTDINPEHTPDPIDEILDKPGPDHRADVEENIPTQIAHPGKATARTVFSVLLAVLFGVVMLGPEIIDAILVEETLPDNLRAGLAGVATVIVALAGIFTRIMAIPGVNKILKKFKLGTGVESEQ